MKEMIVVGPRGYIGGTEHQKALETGGNVPPASAVRFYFGLDDWMDVKFERDAHGKPCLQVRAMSHSVPSLSIQPSSGNTIFIVPGV